MIVRASTTEDATALAEIYGHHVLNGFGTFEEVPPSVQDMAARRQAIVERGLPYLVAEDDGRILGFAYAGPFRPRAAYRYTVEDSVYIAPDEASIRRHGELGGFPVTRVAQVRQVIGPTTAESAAA